MKILKKCSDCGHCEGFTEELPVKCILNVGRNLHRLLELRTSFLGITPIQSRIIGFIYANEQEGQPIYQKDIEETFRIRRSSVSSVLQLLERKDYIRRESVREDARLKRLSLTAEGLRIQNQSVDFFKQLDMEIKGCLTEEESHIFFECMKKIDHKITNLYNNKEETND